MHDRAATELDEDAARLIKHILEYCRGEGMRAVCEGIETREELQVVARLGVSLVQGFLLARPGPPFPAAAVGAQPRTRCLRKA